MANGKMEEGGMGISDIAYSVDSRLNLADGPFGNAWACIQHTIDGRQADTRFPGNIVNRGFTHAPYPRVTTTPVFEVRQSNIITEVRH